MKLQEAIEEITYAGKRFPAEAFRTIKANREEALPYLREALEKAIDENFDLDLNYLLYFYALYLLGELKDTQAFPLIIRFVSMPAEAVYYLAGEEILDGLQDILYNTYNGDFELLKASIQNENIDEYIRSELLDVMAQLCLDGTLDEAECKTFMKRLVYGEKPAGKIVCSELAVIIGQCGFHDMLREIHCMQDRKMMDPTYFENHNEFIASVNRGSESARKFCQDFCKSPMNAAEYLKNTMLAHTFGHSVKRSTRR